MVGGPSTAWTLIEGAAAGDDRARALFADRYLPVVRAYLVARWRGTPLLDAVEDATQDAFAPVRDEANLRRLPSEEADAWRSFWSQVRRRLPGSPSERR